MVVVTNTRNFRISLSEISLPIHSQSVSYGTLSSYGLIPVSSQNMNSYFGGKEDTMKIINFNSANGTNTTSYAAPYCHAQHFAYGNEEVYLPSVGQLLLIYNNRITINSCLTACGGTQLRIDNFNSDYWSSSYAVGEWAGTDNIIMVYIGNGATTYNGYLSYINGSHSIRPVADYE